MFHNDFQDPHLSITSPCLQPKFDHNLRVTDIRIWGCGGRDIFHLKNDTWSVFVTGQSVTGLPPQRPTFCPRSVHVGFVVDGETLGQIFLQVPRTYFTFLTPLCLINLCPLIFVLSVCGRFIPIYLLLFSYGNAFDLRPLFQEQREGRDVLRSPPVSIIPPFCLFVLFCSF